MPVNSAVHKLLGDCDVVVQARVLFGDGPHSLTEETVCDAENVGLVNNCQVLERISVRFLY